MKPRQRVAGKRVHHNFPFSLYTPLPRASTPDNCVFDGLVLDVTGSGECLTDQTALNATFTFDVDVSEAHRRRYVPEGDEYRLLL